MKRWIALTVIQITELGGAAGVPRRRIQNGDPVGLFITIDHRRRPFIHTIDVVDQPLVLELIVRLIYPPPYPEPAT